MRLLRKVRDCLGPFEPYQRNPFLRQQGAFGQARILTQVFYLMLVPRVSELVGTWSQRRAVAPVSPLWPLAWLDRVGIGSAVDFITIVFSAGVILSILFPAFRSARVLAFLGIFFQLALENSFGKVDHGRFIYLYTSFFFIFLPKISGTKASRAMRQKYLSIFSGAQAMLLCIYTASGIWKAYAIVRQVGLSEPHLLSPEGFPSLVAFRLIQGGQTTSLLGPFVIDHPHLGQVAMGFALYLEIFAIFALFRPSIQRMFGLLIVVLHLGTALTVTVRFDANIWVAGLLLMLSPFHVPEVSLASRLKDLPLVSLPFRIGRAVRRLKSLTPIGVSNT